MKELLDALRAAIVGVQPVESKTAAPLVAVPNGFELKSLENYMPAPARIEGNVQLYRYSDFVAYVNKYKGSDARIFVDKDLAFTSGGEIATAALDYPTPGKPGWSEHNATLNVAPSIEYARLREIDGKLLDQDKFALTVKDLARFVTGISASDLLEILQKMTLTAKGEFRSIMDELTGSVNFGYDVKVDAKLDSTSTRTLEIPTTIGFGMKLLKGGTEQPVVTELCYRVPSGPGGKVQLGLRIVDRQYLEDDVLTAVADSLVKDTALPVAIGQSDVGER